MKKLTKTIASVSFVMSVVVGSLGVVTAEAACSSVCSSDEEASCTNTFTTCIAEAAASADLAKCQTCSDNYCSCFDSCGSTCDRSRVANRCGN